MLRVCNLQGSGYRLGEVCFYAINEISLRQGCISAHVQERVNAVIDFLVSGIAPLGTLLAGILSQFMGIRLTLFCGACGMLLITIWLAFAFRKQRA